MNLEKPIVPENIVLPGSFGRPSLDRSLEIEEWQEFEPLLSGFSRQDRADIEFAYGLAQGAHRGQFRESGERYFSHPREVTIILLEAGEADAETIIAALEHDVPEDTDYLERAYVEDSDPVENLDLGEDGNEKFYYLAAGVDRIAVAFSNKVASMVDDLTKLEPNKYISKKEVENMHLETLRLALPGTIKIKMADRLHNLRTLDAKPLKKQIATVKETRKNYLPIFKTVLESDPQVGGRILNQIEVALANLEKELHL